MSQKKYHPKFQAALNKMFSDIGRTDYYYYFLTYFNIVESNRGQTTTMGVCLTDKGPLLVYSPKFCDDHTVEELVFVLAHECMHILLKHCKESPGYKDYEANIAQDMVINTTLMEQNYSVAKTPGKLYFVPEDYKGAKIWEALYKFNKGGEGGGQPGEKGGEGGGQPGEKGGEGGGQPGEKPSTIEGKNAPSKVNIEDMLSPEEIKENGLDNAKKITDENVIDSIIDNIQNSMRNRGHGNAEIENMLGQLTKTKHDYIAKALRALKEMLGYSKVKVETWSRPSRRGSGIKGSKTEQYEINVILDVSGSMFGNLEKVVSTLYKRNIEMNVIQIATEPVLPHLTITRSNQLQQMAIKATGGTEINPAIIYISEHKVLKKLPTLILTDGYTDFLETSKLAKHSLILTVHYKPPMDKAIECLLIKEE